MLYVELVDGVDGVVLLLLFISVCCCFCCNSDLYCSSDNDTSSHTNNSRNTTTNKQSTQIKSKVKRKSYQELTQLNLIQTINEHHGPIWTFSISCDGQFIATGGQDGTVRIWAIIGSSAANELDEQYKSELQQNLTRLYITNPIICNVTTSVASSSRSTSSIHS